ncbi:ABC transporter ATP-binding protein [Raineya orbicola]|uniref:ABC-type multidrug transport system ATPase and permease component n=1 Tax=Raineya orbicola TaxID=2016530 RepID=A0A2N3IHU5_9BACT|nr:ABC transporter ATP-binding protein [Raineya orbicola]PKQ69866.1 ABC-type multidrug transport system ATPase and permease component [Raineya orbicola]
MKTYLRIFTLVDSIYKFIFAFLATSLLASLFGLVNFTMIIPVLEILFQNKPQAVAQPPNFQFSVEYFVQTFQYWQAKIYYEKGAVSLLWNVCLFVVISVFLANLFKYLTIRVLEKLKANLVGRIRQRVFEKTLDLHLGYFTEQRKGNILSRMTSDVAEVEFILTTSFKALFREPILLILYFVALFYISPSLTLFVLVYIPLTGGFVGLLINKLRKQSKQVQETIGTVLSIMDETFSGIRIVKAFNAEKFVKQKFKTENEKYTYLVKSIGYKRELSSPFSEFMGVALVIGVVLYGGNLILQGDKSLTASQFFGFLGILSQVTQPIKEIITMFSHIQRGVASAERIFELIDIKPEIQDRPNAKDLPTFNERITFENVSFAYRNEQWVLKNINLSITKGKMIALVGASGSGKSTIADLLCRFYEVQKGRILIDGYDIKEITMHSLRKQMGIVSQEAILFNDTVFNNIAFGKEATMEEVIQAAKIAHAHEFIEKLPQGYHTNIGERGSQLSGGQRQRISIARAVLKNPPILILDEATSALDNESEKIVQEALNELMQERTALVIAHRLSTIQKADEILVMDKGEIVERGTHQELLSTPHSLYAKLYRSAEIIEDLTPTIETKIV